MFDRQQLIGTSIYHIIVNLIFVGELIYVDAITQVNLNANIPTCCSVFIVFLMDEFFFSGT
jgi:hypothetical protein